MQTLESAINTPSAAIRDEWQGMTGMLDLWIKSDPKFNHTHYLASADYCRVFDYIFLQLGQMRKRHIAVIVNDTSVGDHRDEIRLIHLSKKFKIRPI